MNLADMLSYADIHQLTRIAKTYQCECSGNSKNELIQSILSTVARREVFDQQIHQMSLEDLRFLNSLLFDRRNSFSLEELVARVQQTKFTKSETGADGGNPRDVIAKFKHYGWLFNGYSQQTKFLFQVPEDLKRRFSDTLTRRFQEQLTTIEEPSVYRDEPMLLVEDTYGFLQHLYHNEAALTADGFLYKRHLQQLLAKFAIQEEPVGRVGWRFGYGRRYKEYPSRFSLIYDYCFYNRWIEERGDHLSLTALGRERVAEQVKEDPVVMCRFWIRLYKGAIPNLLSLVHWIERLTRSWTTADSLFQVLGPLIKPYYYDSAESILQHRILQMMMHLGLVRIGEHEHFGKVVQMNEAGSRIVHGVYVQHDDKVDIPIDKRRIT